MRKFLTTATLAACLAGGAQAATPDCDREVFRDFVSLFYDQAKVAEAFTAYVAPDYIQHSDKIGQGRDAAVAFLTPMFTRAGFRAQPVRIWHDGDLANVLLKVVVDGQPKAVVLDIFRVKDCKLIEHWDIKQELDPAKADAFFANLGGQQ